MGSEDGRDDGNMEARGHQRRPWRAAAIGNGEPGSNLGHGTSVGWSSESWDRWWWLEVQEMAGGAAAAVGALLGSRPWRLRARRAAAWPL
jgi:hypothetical protein